MTVTLHHADCLSFMRVMAAESVHAIVCDPPAAITFCGHEWDSDKGGRRHWIQWLSERTAEMIRILRPGGHVLMWALPRKSHWTSTALEDMGFEIRDVITHLFAQGQPKGRNLKPAAEFWILARKPLIGAEANNRERYGTGSLQIDQSRLAPGDGGSREGEETAEQRYAERGATSFAFRPGPRGGAAEGRWPTNVVFSHAEGCQDWECVDGCPVTELERQKPTGARFYFVAKPSSAERGRSRHPTPKSRALMGHLVGLVAAPGQTVLDPFAGSGGTLLGCLDREVEGIGVELLARHVQDAKLRFQDSGLDLRVVEHDSEE